MFKNDIYFETEALTLANNTIRLLATADMSVRSDHYLFMMHRSLAVAACLVVTTW